MPKIRKCIAVHVQIAEENTRQDKCSHRWPYFIWRSSYYKPLLMFLQLLLYCLSKSLLLDGFGVLLLQLLRSRNLRLHADAAKHQADT